MMKRAIIIPLLFSLFPVLIGLTPISRVLAHRYAEQIGSNSHEIQWVLEQKNRLRKLTTVRMDETSVSIHDESLSTVSWTFSKPSTDCRIIAEREGSTVHIKGTFHGEEVQKEFRIDDTPWCQATALALSTIMESDCKETTFWTIWTERLSPYKVTARKCGVEQITIQGNDVTAQKIEIRPTGLLSILWRGVYWFRMTDNVFLKYESATGLSGSDKTVITLISEETNIPRPSIHQGTPQITSF
jgi:hypothetical protein